MKVTLKDIIAAFPVFNRVHRIQVIGEVGPRSYSGYGYPAPLIMHDLEMRTDTRGERLYVVTLEEEKPKKQYVQLRVAKGGELNNENKENKEK